MCAFFDVEFKPIRYTSAEWKEVQEAKEEEENERMANRAQLDDPSLSREDALKKVEEYKKEEEDRKKAEQEAAEARQREAEAQREAAEEAELRAEAERRAEGDPDRVEQELTALREEKRQEREAETQRNAEGGLALAYQRAQNLPPEERAEAIEEALQAYNQGREGGDRADEARMRALVEQSTQSVGTKIAEAENPLPANPSPRDIRTWATANDVPESAVQAYLLEQNRTQLNAALGETGLGEDDEAQQYLTQLAQERGITGPSGDPDPGRMLAHLRHIDPQSIQDEELRRYAESIQRADAQNGTGRFADQPEGAGARDIFDGQLATTRTQLDANRARLEELEDKDGIFFSDLTSEEEEEMERLRADIDAAEETIRTLEDDAARYDGQSVATLEANQLELQFNQNRAAGEAFGVPAEQGQAYLDGLLEQSGISTPVAPADTAGPEAQVEYQRALAEYERARASIVTAMVDNQDRDYGIPNRAEMQEAFAGVAGDPERLALYIARYGPEAAVMANTQISRDESGTIEGPIANQFTVNLYNNTQSLPPEERFLAQLTLADQSGVSIDRLATAVTNAGVQAQLAGQVSEIMNDPNLRPEEINERLARIAEERGVEVTQLKNFDTLNNQATAARIDALKKNATPEVRSEIERVEAMLQEGNVSSRERQTLMRELAEVTGVPFGDLTNYYRHYEKDATHQRWAEAISGEGATLTDDELVLLLDSADRYKKADGSSFTPDELIEHLRLVDPSTIEDPVLKALAQRMHRHHDEDDAREAYEEEHGEGSYTEHQEQAIEHEASRVQREAYHAKAIESGLTPDELDRDGFNLAERTGLKPSESFETLANAPAEGSLGAPLSEDQLAEAAQALDGLSGLNEAQRQARLAELAAQYGSAGIMQAMYRGSGETLGVAQRDANGNVVTQDGATVFNNSLVVDEQLSARMSDIDQLGAHLPPDEREALQRQAWERLAQQLYGPMDADALASQIQGLKDARDASRNVDAALGQIVMLPDVGVEQRDARIAEIAEQYGYDPESLKALYETRKTRLEEKLGGAEAIQAARQQGVRDRATADITHAAERLATAGADLTNALARLNNATTDAERQAASQEVEQLRLQIDLLHQRQAAAQQILNDTPAPEIPKNDEARSETTNKLMAREQALNDLRSAAPGSTEYQQAQTALENANNALAEHLNLSDSERSMFFAEEDRASNRQFWEEEVGLFDTQEGYEEFMRHASAFPGTPEEFLHSLTLLGPADFEEPSPFAQFREYADKMKAWQAVNQPITQNAEIARGAKASAVSEARAALEQAETQIRQQTSSVSSAQRAAARVAGPNPYAGEGYSYHELESMLISELEAFKTTDATVIHLLTAMTPEQVARFIQSNPILDGDDSLLGQIDDGVDGEAFRVVKNIIVEGAKLCSLKTAMTTHGLHWVATQMVFPSGFDQS